MNKVHCYLIILSTTHLSVGAWGKIFHFDNPNIISFKSIFCWIDNFCSSHNQTQLEILPHKEWWNKLHLQINASQSCIHEKYHKERLDKLSALLLFTDGFSTDNKCYALESSTTIGNIKFPLVTSESFTKFISAEFS